MESDQQQRAAAAFKLFAKAIRDDDQAAFDFLHEGFQQQGLWKEFRDDDGRAYASADEFARDCIAEFSKVPNGSAGSASASTRSGLAIHASAGDGSRANLPFCEMSPEQRRQERAAQCQSMLAADR